MYWRNYGLWSALLDKCLKSPVSEDPTIRYIVNGPKHCWNMHDSTFIIFTEQCERNWVGKVCISDMESVNTFC